MAVKKYAAVINPNLTVSFIDKNDFFDTSEEAEIRAVEILQEFEKRKIPNVFVTIVTVIVNEKDFNKDLIFP